MGCTLSTWRTPRRGGTWPKRRPKKTLSLSQKPLKVGLPKPQWTLLVRAKVRGVGEEGGSARKLSYMEKKEYDRLEGEIEKLSKERDALDAKLEAASNGGIMTL